MGKIFTFIFKWTIGYLIGSIFSGAVFLLLAFYGLFPREFLAGILQSLLGVAMSNFWLIVIFAGVAGGFLTLAWFYFNIGQRLTSLGSSHFPISAPKKQETKNGTNSPEKLQASVPEDFFDDHITWGQLGFPEKPGTVDVVNLGQVKVDKNDINEANKAGGNLKFKLINASSKDFRQSQYLLGSTILTNKPLQSTQPKRIKLTELRDHAIERGWRFNQDSYEALDFLDAIRQSAVDETLTVYGREKKTAFDEITRTEPLIPIPKKYWHDHQIEISRVLRAIDNYLIETVSRSPLDRDKGIVYADLQADRNEALKWFNEDAAQHKGKREKAYDENA